MKTHKKRRENFSRLLKHYGIFYFLATGCAGVGTVTVTIVDKPDFACA
jgi:hypothetical protein